MLHAMLLLGCQSAPTSSPDPIAEATWSPCDRAPGSGDAAAECATVPLPWDHEDPDGERFDALVKRIPAQVDATAQLWLLHGGPGASAVDDLHVLPPDVALAHPSFTLYAVDHRGVGGTARLGCGAEAGDSEGAAAITETEWPGCLEEVEATWGEHLPQLSTTQSAHDLATLIEVLRVPGQQTMIYGGSYGTILAQRLLHLRPDLIDAVVLDGLADPATGFRGYDRAMDAAGHALLDLCAADRACADHFDVRPAEAAAEVVAALDAGHCPALGLDGDGARNLLGAMLLYDKVRDLVPATVRRLERCDARDVEVLTALRTNIHGLGATPEQGNQGVGASNVLFFHVALSEMWFETADPTAILADWRTLTLSTGLEVWLAARSQGWPRYTPDPRREQVPTYTGPLLILQGGLDAATPVGPALAIAERFTGELQHTALFPEGAHGLVGGATLPDQTDCGQRLFDAFLADPRAELDTRCVQDVLPVQFDGYDTVTRGLFGTVDAWGD